jgi:hypothetical protein
MAAQASRTELQEDIAYQEKRTRDLYLHDSLAWLKVADEQQDDELETLSDRRHIGTCQWILKNDLFQHWKDCWILSSNHLEVIANTVANTVARITNSVFVITYLSVWVAYMSDLLISRICQGATLRNTGLSPITVRNIEACRTMGRPIYTGYFPLNKESSLENQQTTRVIRQLRLLTRNLGHSSTL